MLLILFVIFTSVFASAQQNDYSYVDQQVAGMGEMAESNLALITQTITAPFSDKEQKARAIFYWITHHIAINPKATKGNDQKKTTPEDVIQLRKTTPLGYSLLVQEMCSQANIRCLSVDGYTKYSSDDIGEVPDEINHSWNVVQLGQSPDEWYYVDAAKGSGYLDKRMTVFTPLFSGNYFFTDREVFNMDHFPDNEAWRLGPGPRSLKEFYAMPVYHPFANTLDITKMLPQKGKIKTKSSKAVEFSFSYSSRIPITSLEVVTGEDKRASMPQPVKFTDSNHQIKFTYQFRREDEYPVVFLVNSNAVLTYIVDSEE